MSNLNIYGFTVEGENPNHIRKRYLGVAPDMESAMGFADNTAKNDGWTKIVYVDISLIGCLSFFVLPQNDGGFLEELSKDGGSDCNELRGLYTTF